MIQYQKRIIGAVFPIKQEHVPKLFGGNCDIFVKFTNFSLENGSRIVFYVSGKKLLIGEAKICQIERLSSEVAWNRYRDRLFLDEEEYGEYVRISPITKEARKIPVITAFRLKNLRKYKKPVRAINPITPSGRYLTKEMLDRH